MVVDVDMYVDVAVAVAVDVAVAQKEMAQRDTHRHTLRENAQHESLAGCYLTVL